MNPTADGTDAIRQAPFDRSLAILLIQGYAPFAACVLRCNLLKSCPERPKILCTEQSGSVQPFSMRNRPLHVVRDKPIIERVILTGRVIKDAGV
jgi:hypothetical protein